MIAATHTNSSTNAYAFGQLGRRRAEGVSDAASLLHAKESEYVAYVASSAIGETRFAEPRSMLFQEYAEAKNLAAADDYKLPSPGAIQEALELIDSAPSWAPPPAPVVELNSGAIAFEWDVGPDRFFVLAVNGTRRLEYSAIFGLGDERHGAIAFNGGMPHQVRALIAEMLRS